MQGLTLNGNATCLSDNVTRIYPAY